MIRGREQRIGRSPNGSKPRARGAGRGVMRQSSIHKELELHC